ncbi:DUF5641 domain-containing protein [Trichonephila clavata]|uniref:DUF5641 domain-containing protein n=1 Tax=Trichonephila clavata TaxID=2740835 RepID=A0A8X6LR59_TRICU|nr:DUF5641 domain-containing protein [Trichonephila clavata]
MIDDDNILRIKSHLTNYSLDDYEKHTIILSNDYFASLIVYDCHEKVLHNGVNETLKQVRIEGAPWWGGFWERLVRSVKNCFKCVLGKTSLMYEELNIEVEANSMSLTYIYNDVNEPDPLTPSHFTVGSRLTTLPSPKLNANSINVELTKKWKYRQLLLDHFWKRFFKEYLLELRSVMFTKQSKNIPNLKFDDAVLIREDNVKRYNWKLGKIKKLFPGRDGKCEIQLSKGVVKIPVERLYNLEVKNTG